MSAGFGRSQHLDDARFADAADGATLDPRAARHLQHCALCTQRVGEARAIREAVLRGSEPDIDAPAGLTERTVRALHARKRDAATLNELLGGIAEVVRGAAFLAARPTRTTAPADHEKDDR